MGPSFLNQRGLPELESAPLIASDGSSPVVPPGLVGQANARNVKDVGGSSGVWSEIRHALSTMGRSSRSESESSTVLASRLDESPSANSKGKGVIRVRHGDAYLSPLQKSKRVIGNDLVRRLGLQPAVDRRAKAPLCVSALRKRTPHRALVGGRSAPSSETASAVPSSGNKTLTVKSDGVRQFSTESRFSDTPVMKDSLRIRQTRRHLGSKSSPDGEALQTIDESYSHAQPTIVTVEKAAAAKIFLETHFNGLLTRPDTRLLRRQYLESQLYYSPHLTPEQKDAIRCSFYQQESCYTREFRALKVQSLSSLTGRAPTTTVDTYESLKVLGRGSFGVVKLVRERFDAPHASTGQVFAMKVIRKSNMLRSSQEGHLRAERDFLVASEGSQWIIPLVASFQDLRSLYLVMEYMPGGDFLGLLIRKNNLHESAARFYVAEMILAVEETHRLKFIHRDIKPDNFLISASGHLKISDFGLAFGGSWSHDTSYINHQRYSLLQSLGIGVDGDEEDRRKRSSITAQLPWVRSQMHHNSLQYPFNAEDLPFLLKWRNGLENRTAARSVVGTSQYMAPESIGIILYECLYGFTPFFDEGRKKTKTKILNHQKLFAFPHMPPVSNKCKDLVASLIREKEYRLCSRQYHIKDRAQIDARQPVDFSGRFVFPDDAEDIKAHRWFKNLPWDRIHASKPPFVPNIASLEDTRYFEDSEPFDMTDSSLPAVDVTADDVRTILHEFRAPVQALALDLISTPHDSAQLRSTDRRIDDTLRLSAHEKRMLKHFVRMYGRKEQRRPRDILLRDENTKDAVMDVRKKTAFIGYTWRRMRPGGYTTPL
ncbi:hypothetical protein HIM_02494 [Hirsutella minnesotensis 3608]|nr:hypothetical protein HIM_02494 [Hirsutella minnesotensis 3608]